MSLSIQASGRERLRLQHHKHWVSLSFPGYSQASLGIPRASLHVGRGDREE